MTIKNYNDQTAYEALKQAQLIAVGPFIFKAVSAMKQFGVLKCLAEVKHGSALTKFELAEKCGISIYAVSVLIDLAVVADIVIKVQDETDVANEKRIQNSYMISKVGEYLYNDKMTNINFEFTDQVCYEGLDSLAYSLEHAVPKGLEVFTKDYDTIYPFLGSLPPKAQKAWFDFDHFYSDHVFKDILPKLFAIKPIKHIYDIGGNTGKFSIEATTFNEDVNVTIIDLPQVCNLATKNIAEKGLSNRINTYPVNILDKNLVLPKEADLWWMSQFLDCFSLDQIEHILNHVYQSMSDGAMLAINEIFGDCQSNDIAELVIEANSLYFTALANGRSRFYHAKEFNEILTKVGFKLVQRFDNIGLGHTLLVLEK